MPASARLGDTISHGGSIVQGSPKKSINGKPAARLGDACVCAIHGGVNISSASSTVSVDGKGQARIGDSVSCGATIVSGSPDTYAG